ncbi:hypothetical protein LLEC1_07143, partial [Akanthomyces lecanii]
SRDYSVFPTEDNRLNLPTIMLFQAYTACRPVELINGIKCRGARDPMLDNSNIEDIESNERGADNAIAPGAPSRSIKQKRKRTMKLGYKLEADANSGLNDSDDRESDTKSDGNTDGGTNTDDDGDDTSDTKYSDVGSEDIIRDLTSRGRDVLAIEVFFHYYKGVDNKLKLTSFIFYKNPLPILYPISYILTHIIYNNIVDINSFSYIAPFFSIRISRAATKDAFLKRDPSTDRLTRTFSHISIQYNPKVPRYIPKAELAKFPPNLKVVELAREVK